MIYGTGDIVKVVGRLLPANCSNVGSFIGYTDGVQTVINQSALANDLLAKGNRLLYGSFTESDIPASDNPECVVSISEYHYFGGMGIGSIQHLYLRLDEIELVKTKEQLLKEIGE